MGSSSFLARHTSAKGVFSLTREGVQDYTVWEAYFLNKDFFLFSFFLGQLILILINK